LPSSTSFCTGSAISSAASSVASASRFPSFGSGLEAQQRPDSLVRCPVCADLLESPKRTICRIRLARRGQNPSARGI
jgi:hypothetical protein